jgi:hypothetical protein
MHAGIAYLFKAYPGDFPDPFDHWQLDNTAPLQQKFPLNINGAAKYYY